MDTSEDSIPQKLTITRQNRHQYFETQMNTAFGADREIRMAAARGRERRLREQAVKKAVIRIGWIVLAGAACTAALVLLQFLV